MKTVKISELIPDARNANKGTGRGAAQLEISLRKYGAGRSVLLDKNGRIIAGNKTVENAAAIGLDDMIVVETTGDKLVAVKRTDLDLTDDSTGARALAYADNRVAQVGLEWDAEVVYEDFNIGIELGDFFKDDELADILGDLLDDDTEGDTDPIYYESNYSILINFDTEHEQSIALEELTKLGYKCQWQLSDGQSIPAKRRN